MNIALRWLLLIPFAVACAALAAACATFVAAAVAPAFGETIGVALWKAFWVLLDRVFANDNPERDLAIVFGRATSLVAAVAFAPPIITAVASELFRWRGWMAQAGLAGALTVLFPLALLGPQRNLSGAETRMLAALALIGVVSGTVYWLIAGRSAGEKRLSAPASTGS